GERAWQLLDAIGQDHVGREAVDAAEAEGDEDLIDQLVLAAEVVVEARLLHPEPARELAQAGSGVAALGEEVERDAEQLAVTLAELLASPLPLVGRPRHRAAFYHGDA